MLGLVDAGVPRESTRETRVVRYRSAEDSVASVVTRAAAERAEGLRVVVSLADRELYVLQGSDTVRVARVAVASDTTLEFDGRRWTFSTPRGRRTVLGKKENPVWTPPDWHYAEVARDRGLRLAALSPRRPTLLADGRRLVVRGGRVGIVAPGADFEPLPAGDEIIFDSTVFVPPFGTENRRIPGELGRHLLDMGEGYLLHGTPYTSSIGTAATHGCVRMRDEDVEWLYANVPVGTHVYVY
jgi:lipoprotein-anchoring transpeptidase ErfK/SrfK